MMKYEAERQGDHWRVFCYQDGVLRYAKTYRRLSKVDAIAAAQIDAAKALARGHRTADDGDFRLAKPSRSFRF